MHLLYAIVLYRKAMMFFLNLYSQLLRYLRGIRMTTVLITGANRGIGFTFTTQYLEQGCHVIACARNVNSSALLALQKQYSEHLVLEQLDVTDLAQVQALAVKITAPIDILINNAGIYRGQQAVGFVYEKSDWLDSFEANTMAPFYVTTAFLPHLKKSQQGKVAIVTSKMGSMDDNTSGGSYIYRASKAAVNAVAKSFAVDLVEDGISVALLHPGWVKTDMTNNSGLIDAQTSVQGMRSVIESCGLASTGQFIAYDGKHIAW